MTVAPEPTSPAPPTPWRACWAVAVLAAALGACTIFPSLGASRMGPDESLYALVTDDVRATGRWSTVHLAGDHPYFNKPPLYVWLSALTYDRLPGFEVRYRFWSAAFGVVAVGLTAAWGSRLFRPAVGFAAGCALATNRSFLAEHGARFGGMDAALAACFVGILLLYGVGRSGRGRWGAWAAMGAVAGVATMFKPIAGLPMLAVVAAHAVLVRGDAPPVWRRRLAIVGVVLVAAAIVGLPWYLQQLARFGPDFAHQVIVNQVVERAAGDGPAGEHQPWWYYLVALPRASNLFLLAPPALLWLIVTLRGRHDGRAGRSLVLLVIVAWVGGFSLSSGKFIHYLYPAFGAVCVAIAAMVVESAGWVARRWRGGDARAASVAATAVAIVFAEYVAFVAANPGSRDRSPLASWQVYRTFEPAIRDGRMDLIFWGVPNDPADWPDPWAVRPNFMIYLSHMAVGRRADNADEVNRILASGRPALVVFGRGADVTRVPALRPTTDVAGSWADARFSANEKAYAVAAVGVDRLLRVVAAPGRGDPRLTVAGGARLPLAFEGAVTVTVAFPLPQPARVTFTVRAAPGSPSRVLRCTIRGAGADPDVLAPFALGGWTPVSAVAPARENAAKPTRPIELRIEPADGDPTPVRAELLAVSVESFPPVPGAPADLP